MYTSLAELVLLCFPLHLQYVPHDQAFTYWHMDRSLTKDPNYSEEELVGQQLPSKLIGPKPEREKEQ